MFCYDTLGIFPPPPQYVYYFLSYISKKLKRAVFLRLFLIWVAAQQLLFPTKESHNSISSSMFFISHWRKVYATTTWNAQREILWIKNILYSLFYEAIYTIVVKLLKCFRTIDRKRLTAPRSLFNVFFLQSREGLTK